jgi:hypothetical protein
MDSSDRHSGVLRGDFAFWDRAETVEAQRDLRPTAMAEP